jgi:hypothetical protein
MIEIFAVQPKFVTIVAHDRVIRVPAIIENKWWINLSLFVFITIVLFQKLFYFTIRYRLDLLYIGIVVFDPLVNWVNIIFVEHIKIVHLFLSLIDIILTYEKFLTFPNTFFRKVNKFQNGLRVEHDLQEIHLQYHSLHGLHYHRGHRCATV